MNDRKSLLEFGIKEGDAIEVIEGLETEINIIYEDIKKIDIKLDDTASKIEKIN